MKTVIEMAGEVDAVTKVLLDRKEPQGMSHDVFIWFLERFAELVRADERSQRTWVGLTDEEILAANYPDGEENGPTISAPDFELNCFAKQVEAKLKEKNT